jgi:hypothetical protein
MSPIIAINATCLLSFFSTTIISSEPRWELCEDDPHCLCGSWGHVAPLCAPPDIAQKYCSIVDPATETTTIANPTTEVSFLNKKNN